MVETDSPFSPTVEFPLSSAQYQNELFVIEMLVSVGICGSTVLTPHQVFFFKRCAKERGEAEMTTCCFNMFTVLIIQSFIFHQSHGFKVTQPQCQTINLDRSASISCEYTAEHSSVQDVRLNSVSPGAPSTAVCQKGKPHCNNIFMYKENPNKYIFILLNIGSEAKKITYQCEVTATINGLDQTEKGSPTTLQEARFNQTKPEDCETAHPSTPPLYNALTTWTLIGLLILATLYSCVITGSYIKLRMTLRKNKDTTTTTRELDNSTYVEMRKAPLPMNPSHNIYRE